jgi:hypothetical protein
VFGSERLTGALLDRLTHHVHIHEMNGDSFRLEQSKRRIREVQPTTGQAKATGAPSCEDLPVGGFSTSSERKRLVNQIAAVSFERIELIAISRRRLEFWFSGTFGRDNGGEPKTSRHFAAFGVLGRYRLLLLRDFRFGDYTSASVAPLTFF